MVNFASALNRILVLCAWGGVSFLVLLLYRVARFYQMTANEHTHYRWFILPLVLFVLAAMRYAWIADFAGDPLGDVLAISAGSALILLGYRLLNLMMGGHQ